MRRVSRWSASGMIRSFGVALLLAIATAPAAAVTVGGPFTLVTPDGKTVTDQTFRGAWLLVYFGYTSCPESCPTALVSIAKVLADLGPQAARIHAIFITIDPLHDTMDRMGEYTGSFDPRILGLSGTPRQIDDVSKAYGVYVDQVSDPRSKDVRIDHSTYIYLMNPSGAFVRAFVPSWSSEKMASAVRGAIARGLASNLASSSSLPR